MSGGKIYGVGLGPGAADLMSVRADRLLRGARNVAFFRKAGRRGRAVKIAEGIVNPEAVQFPMEYPVTTEIPFEDPAYNACLSAFYEGCATHLKSLAQAGEDVVVLCEGDPFFYGSFMHLHSSLHVTCEVEIVPAITGMSAAWTATGLPITWGDDVLTVLMGTMAEAELTTRMQTTDALVIMKIGRNLPTVRRALETAGLMERAWLVQFAAMEGQSVERLAETQADTVPYFSIILVHGQGRRP